MEKKYYIQSGTAEAKDIFSEFGIYVSKVVGLNNLSDAKSRFDTSTDRDQGVLQCVPEESILKDKSVTITFISISQNAMQSTLELLEYVMSSGDLSYFDTYRSNGFRGSYVKSSVISEKYRDSGDFFEFELTFSVPNGIGYGYDNASGSDIVMNVTKGYVDLYFSDGFQLFNQTGTINRSQAGGFVIVCPSINENVNILS